MNSRYFLRENIIATTPEQYAAVVHGRAGIPGQLPINPSIPTPNYAPAPTFTPTTPGNPANPTPDDQGTFFQRYKKPILIGGTILGIGLVGYFALKK